MHIRKARLAYPTKEIFTDLEVNFPTGKWSAILGPSGVGKSSLLRMIGGIMPVAASSQCEIYANNHTPLKDQMAYMGQTDLLLPWLTVLDNSLLSIKLCKKIDDAGKSAKQEALELLNRVGLRNAIHLYPHQLSGGMRQRVALVRTLLQKKPIVLMDEPFSALDAINRYHLQAIAAQLLCDKTVLFITHDPSEALRLAHHIYIMQGQPATLKWVSQLSSSTPREPTAPEMIKLQAMLFTELTRASAQLCD